MDPTFVHESGAMVGYVLGLLNTDLLVYKNKALHQKIDGIEFENPLGLAAGFDYDGYLANTMHAFGFAFNSVGTVTKLPYKGNPGKMLGRLPKSKSLLVNKGFKNPGVHKIIARLSKMPLANKVVGISVGNSNFAEIDTLTKVFDDYVYSYEHLKDKEFIKYFELNISCPNTKLGEPFYKPDIFGDLVKVVSSIGLAKPIYVKMPNELSEKETYALVKAGIDNGVQGFIFSNLVKDRSNPAFDKSEIQKWEGFAGNFSGKPTKANSDKLLRYIYPKVKGHTTLIGTGGVFTAADAYEKIKYGADLVQMVTGLVFGGPATAKKINKGLVDLLQQDGYENISQAVGSAV